MRPAREIEPKAVHMQRFAPVPEATQDHLRHVSALDLSVLPGFGVVAVSAGRPSRRQYMLFLMPLATLASLARLSPRKSARLFGADARDTD